MHSLDVWESKEDSERLYAERMAPVLQQLGIEGGPPLSFQEFELPHVLRGEPQCSDARRVAIPRPTICHRARPSKDRATAGRADAAE